MDTFFFWVYHRPFLEENPLFPFSFFSSVLTRYVYKHFTFAHRICPDKEKSGIVIHLSNNLAPTDYALICYWIQAAIAVNHLT